MLKWSRYCKRYCSRYSVMKAAVVVRVNPPWCAPGLVGWSAHHHSCQRQPSVFVYQLFHHSMDQGGSSSSIQWRSLRVTLCDIILIADSHCHSSIRKYCGLPQPESACHSQSMASCLRLRACGRGGLLLANCTVNNPGCHA